MKSKQMPKEFVKTSFDVKEPAEPLGLEQRDMLIYLSGKLQKPQLQDRSDYFAAKTPWEGDDAIYRGTGANPWLESDIQQQPDFFELF